MPLVLVIAAKDLRQRLRDRSALLLAVVAPLLLATIISLAIGGSFTRFRATFAVADEDKGPVAAAFVDGVLRTPAVAKVVHLRTAASAEEARRLARNDVDAAIVIPPGFSEAVLSGQPAELAVVRSRAGLIGGQLATAIAEGFASRVNSTQLAVRTALASGAGADLAALAQEAGSAAAAAGDSLRDVPSGGRVLRPAAYFGPAMALFFLFFSIGLGARSLLAERASGTLSRLRAAPVRPGVILGGKVLSTFVLGWTSMITLIVATSVLLGAQWGHPLAVLALTTAAVLAVMGIVVLVMSLARTEAQAGAYGSVVAIVLSLLGGSFVPISFAPAILRRLTLITPNGWALHAFTDLATGTRSLATVVTAILVCLGFAVVTGSIGLARAAAAVSE
jgi:ABC-2 type transport system permease protein